MISCQCFQLFVALLNHEQREQARVEYGIGSLQKDMVRLNTLITDKRGKQERLAQGNILTENDFINALKVMLQSPTVQHRCMYVLFFLHVFFFSTL